MMNIKYLGALLLLIVQTTICGAQNKPSESYVLTGKVNGILNGDVQLSEYNSRDRTSTKIATGKVEGGKFKVTGKLSGPKMISLSFTPGNWSTSIFMENSPITLNIDTTGAEHYDYKSSGGKGARLTQVKVNGSASHADYLAFEDNLETKALKTSLTKLNQEYYAEKDATKKEAIKAKLAKDAGVFRNLNFDYIKKFASKKPESVVGVYLFSNYYNGSMPLEQAESLLNTYVGLAKKSPYFSNLQLEIAERKAVLPGNFAEDFTLLQRDSTKFTLSSLRGKYVMIDFWASWCVPCREAIPHWKEIYAKYKDKGFEIVSVTNDSKRNDWIKAMDAEQMPWIQTIDEFPVKMMPARVISKYKHGTIPLYVLLDKQGKILVKTGDEHEIDLKLKELLN
jgi:thiol-disulfide isomerase/thioredoxin